MTSNGCPFQARRGYVDARADYIFHFYKIIEDDSNTDDNNLPTKSLTGSQNVKDPLYFWQIYSLIGARPIMDLVTDFYQRVFDDTENPWFRDVFVEVAPLGHHINAQTAFWIDAFGGGRKYHGGNFRLNFHHTHNARETMNARGAKRWMVHMSGALIAAKDNKVFQEDPRILPCIVDFLEAKMRTYAMDYGWSFDETDFVPLREALSQANSSMEKPSEVNSLSSMGNFQYLH